MMTAVLQSRMGTKYEMFALICLGADSLVVSRQVVAKGPAAGPGRVQWNALELGGNRNSLNQVAIGSIENHLIS